MASGETVRQYNGHHKGKLDRNNFEVGPNVLWQRLFVVLSMTERVDPILQIVCDPYLL